MKGKVLVFVTLLSIAALAFGCGTVGDRLLNRNPNERCVANCNQAPGLQTYVAVTVPPPSRIAKLSGRISDALSRAITRALDVATGVVSMDGLYNIVDIDSPDAAAMMQRSQALDGLRETTKLLQELDESQKTHVTPKK